MTQPSKARQVTGALADATGRTDEELRVALTVGVAAAVLFAVLRFLKFLADLGSNVFTRGKKPA